MPRYRKRSYRRRYRPRHQQHSYWEYFYTQFIYGAGHQIVGCLLRLMIPAIIAGIIIMLVWWPGFCVAEGI